MYPSSGFACDQKLADGAADLQRCLAPDQQQHLAELLARIDAAAQAPAP